MTAVGLEDTRHAAAGTGATAAGGTTAASAGVAAACAAQRRCWRCGRPNDTLGRRQSLQPSIVLLIMMVMMMMMVMHSCLQVQGHGHGMILIRMLMYIIAFLEVIDYLLGRLHVRHKRCLQLQSCKRKEK